MNVRRAVALQTAVREMLAARRKRDRLIIQCHADGASLREIAQLAGLSHAGVKKIIERA